MWRVVLEPQVDGAPGHRRLAPDRVAVDVERVRLVLDVLEAGEEGGVEQGGGHLRDAAAEVLLEDAVGDDEALGEAVLAGPLPHRVVHREGLARCQHGAVDDLGGAPDVDVAVLRVGVVGGERRDLLADVELAGVLGGEVGLLDAGLDLDGALALAAYDDLEQRVADVLGVVGQPGLARHHLRLAVDQRHGGVDRGAVAGGRGVDEAGELLGLHGRLEGAVDGLEPHHGCVLLRVEGHGRVAEVERDRRRHGGVGELLDGAVDVGGVDVGLDLGELELGGRALLAAGLVDVRRHDGLARGVEVELAPGLGLGRLDPVGRQLHLAVDGGLVDLLGEPREGLVERGLVDVDDGVELLAAGVEVPEPVGGPGAAPAGRGDRGGVVDRQAELGRVDLAGAGAGHGEAQRLGEALVEAGGQGALGAGGAAPADVDAGDGGAARHLVAGHGTGHGVAAGGQQHEDAEHQHHGLGAAGLAVVGGSLRVSAHASHSKSHYLQR